MSLLSTEDRRNRLAEILISQGSVKVGVLADSFDVSTETIRKDLIYLESKGIVRKSHGRAVPASNFLDIERPFEKKNIEKTDIKNRIAQAAIDLIPDKGVLILDTGSTVYSLARLLVLKKGLTIFTNSISNVQAIAGSENDVYILGGKIRSTSMASVGSWGVTETNDIHADMVFLGTDGFEGSEGPCTASYEESEIKKAMIKRARIKVIVSDSSKFDIAGLFKFCNWSDVDHFVTDSHISKKALTELSQNVNVITVNDND